MATSFALAGRTEVVRLSQVPRDVRVKAAELAAKRWGLRGAEFLELMIVAQSGSPDAVLSVDVAKIEAVMSGRLPPGSIPKLEEMGG